MTAVTVKKAANLTKMMTHSVKKSFSGCRVERWIEKLCILQLLSLHSLLLSLSQIVQKQLVDAAKELEDELTDSPGHQGGKYPY